MFTLRIPTTGGESLAGASTSSTTISLSGVAIGLVVNEKRAACHPSRRGERRKRRRIDGLFCDEARLGHQAGVEFVVLFEELQHIRAGEKARLERLLLKIVLVFGGLRDLPEQIDVERGLVGRHLPRQEEG